MWAKLCAIREREAPTAFLLIDLLSDFFHRFLYAQKKKISKFQLDLKIGVMQDLIKGSRFYVTLERSKQTHLKSTSVKTNVCKE